jgi:hypothetical protein
MTSPASSSRARSASSSPPLPADDPELLGLDLRELRRHWAASAARAPMTAAAMTGADLRAQALGIPRSTPDDGATARS